VSWVRHTADKRVLGYDDVVGLLFYDRAGNMGVLIIATDKADPKSAASAAPGGDRRGARTYTAYFGNYTVDEIKRTVTHHIRANRSLSSGRDVVRQFAMSGNRLTLTALAEGLTHVLVWERAD
jgi:hypothetical protein